MPRLWNDVRTLSAMIRRSRPCIYCGHTENVRCCEYAADV